MTNSANGYLESQQISPPTLPKVSLYFKANNSDKVYHAQIEAVINNKFVVNFQYGRRGASLTSGTKTSSPVPFEAAKSIFDNLVQEKKAKGYTEGENGTPYQASESAGKVSGLVPQLLNFIEEDEVERYIQDDRWMMQEKVDGVRCMVRKVLDKVEGINRRGLVVNLPDPIVNEIKQLLSDISLDGERVGDTYYVFDILSLNGLSKASDGAEKRFRGVSYLIAKIMNSPALRLVRTGYTEAEKRELFAKVKLERAEGVTFKLKDSKYVPGRPNSGGNHLKFKFWATATVFVWAVNSKRSVAIEVSSFTGINIKVGNVTIPPNQEIPKVGQYIEVRYLYAYPNGSLFQPTYLGVREDKNSPDDYSTLKFKKVTEEEDEA
jgi:bifunctional non-homologous end joining protein LigD